MLNKEKVIENLKMNIAIENLKTEFNSNEEYKEYTHKNNCIIYKMNKTILAISCCAIILIGGVVYAYGLHLNNLNVSSNFFKKENNNYLDRIKENDEVEEHKSIYLNGYLISYPFKRSVSEDSISEHGHSGIDIVTEKGTEILAVAGGTVKEINSNFQYGNYIIIKNDEEYETLYAHLDKITVEEGDTLLQGDEIGTVGATGAVTGPCLHFELHYNGEPVNPLDYIDKMKE